MENTGSLPSSLSFALNQVQGCSTNAFQIASSTGDGSVAANGSIKFNMPTTGIMDFLTSKMYFSVSHAIRHTWLWHDYRNILTSYSRACA